jgi:hypothetical protein
VHTTVQVICAIGVGIIVAAVCFAASQIWKQRLRVLELEVRVLQIEHTCAERLACLTELKTLMHKTGRNVVRLGVTAGVVDLEQLV